MSGGQSGIDAGGAEELGRSGSRMPGGGGARARPGLDGLGQADSGPRGPVVLEARWGGEVAVWEWLARAREATWRARIGPGCGGGGAKWRAAAGGGRTEVGGG